jgi:hypothetical protein
VCVLTAPIGRHPCPTRRTEDPPYRCALGRARRLCRAGIFHCEIGSPGTVRPTECRAVRDSQRNAFEPRNTPTTRKEDSRFLPASSLEDESADGLPVRPSRLRAPCPVSASAFAYFACFAVGSCLESPDLPSSHEYGEREPVGSRVGVGVRARSRSRARTVNCGHGTYGS